MDNDIVLGEGNNELNIILSLTSPEGRVPPCDSMGDLDDDGFVTQTDALMVADWLVGNITLTDEQLRRADVTGDGEVTMSDAMRITQYVDGIIDTFPICEGG